jgi:hypothetical protein
MSKIMYPWWISVADVRDACFVPEKMEPVVDQAMVVIFAALIWEESDPVRENTADFILKTA